jgi:proteic killer suppression protein
VDITFDDKGLAKIANDQARCFKELGQIRGKKFLQRLVALRNANTLEDVRHLPGNYHELVGNRKGTWACDLDHPYRLVFRPHEDPIPTDKDGKFIWVEILGVEVIEIVDYH